MTLKDKVAVVTGAGRGIGEAVALALAQEGIHVVIASRTKTELERVATQIRNLGQQVDVVVADVSKKEDVQHLMAQSLKVSGKIDILVNAAGVYGPIGPTWEVDIEAWTKAIQINLLGTFMSCHAVLPHMIERKQGKIINFSGGGATSPLPRFTAYGISKTAVVRLTETLAEEVKEFNIQINAIAPGAVDTALQDEVLAAGEKAGVLFDRMSQMRETGEGSVPRELAAQLVVFLAGEEAGLTGKLIAAPHDGWQSWDERRIKELIATPWFTLRRMDPFTLQPFVDQLKKE